MQPKIETVLFDVDGTLVDSNDAHANAWLEALAEAGYKVPFAAVRPLIGMGSDKLVPALGLELRAEEEPGKSIVARRKERFLEKYLPSLQAFPGAHDLVNALHERGLRLVVASAASEEELTPLLKLAGVDDLFDHATTPEEIQGTKPEPDVIVAGLNWSRTPPAGALMIGDTRYDVEAAARADVRCIALLCGGSPASELSGAAACFESPAALLAALQDSTLDAVLSPPGASSKGTGPSAP